MCKNRLKNNRRIQFQEGKSRKIQNLEFSALIFTFLQARIFFKKNLSLHSINPLKKSVKKANTRYWQFLLTYFQSKSEKKKNNFQKTNTSRASIVHLFENFSSCGRQTKKVLSFSIDFELQILEKQQNNKNQDTRPPMFPLTILKNFN